MRALLNIVINSNGGYKSRVGMDRFLTLCFCLLMYHYRKKNNSINYLPRLINMLRANLIKAPSGSRIKSKKGICST